MTTKEASEIIDIWFRSLEDKSPINLCFLTQPLSKAIVGRIETLEKAYHRVIVYRFLIRSRIHPLVLFVVVTSGLGYLSARMYKRSTRLVLILVGAVYPLCRSWKCIRQRVKDEEEICKWLTYWMAFGCFQVLDHWIESDLRLLSKRKYNLYKLFILYWLQNPHSNGASLLYQHVLLKPQKEEKEEQDTIIQQQQEDNSYKYLDGYIPYLPPPTGSDNNSYISTSEDDDEDEEANDLIEDSNHSTIIPQEKEPYNLLLNHNEAAW
ncbi:hypothetical protein G6F46_011249 [Rhizopus delemar]|uniref:Protein YOP1 n=2 Tax=Rhizopus TaxID=4842 RepID=A0A9P6YXA3_9FUNG|nr:hypothetical protein G6F55_010712 [Rhizopus delemar]KAG1535818.1 hypothetical protein G6F51_011325 [Rhizopus arrhizus]KAG1490124.1 hypothetical protein G6F54_010953 [Rhizopus delemar]KAG1501378.1 hypothetical protein G6F53_011096 [Rhizopus delemar]KAG1518823.1 hypothetical protein G6F52_008952 [Rhizopus delemar]